MSEKPTNGPDELILHRLVWGNEYDKLGHAATERKDLLEKIDCHGRTPLMLAVTLGHLESTRILLQHDANVNAENPGGWTVLQEAVATGDPELVQLVLERRDFQRHSSRLLGIPELLAKLRDAPDFYVEMKWEFTSWVPLVSRMCPSDTYRVYKSGPNVRIDTTLLGFDHSNWQRGKRSYVFKGQTGETAIMMEIDHDSKQVYVERLQVSAVDSEAAAYLHQSEDHISARLTSPIVTTYIDTDKISFERNKSGIWGWRNDKTETVNGYECKVYGASNVELVTKTRTEHLTEDDKIRNRCPRSPLQSFLGIAETEEKIAAPTASNGETTSCIGNPSNILPDEYFSGDADLQSRDIGRPKEMTVKTQKFKANLWLCDDYPLSLQEQIMPIVDLMAISSTHFAKLKDFITLQLPAGFPVKIEIPIFHVLNARITFGNIFGLDEAIPGVTSDWEADKRLTCVVNEACFDAPADYMQLGTDVRRQFSLEEDDELLQFAIQQSLMDAGSEEDQVTIWEALKNQRPSRPSSPQLRAEEEHQLQRAIQESLALSGALPASLPALEENRPVIADAPSLPDNNSPLDSELRIALELSSREQAEAERRQQEELETLERILQLSLVDK